MQVTSDPVKLPPEKPKGGRRPGAGRPKGSFGSKPKLADHRRRFLAGAMAGAIGPDPFDVVAGKMLWWWNRAVLLRKRVREELERRAKAAGSEVNPDDEFLQAKDSEPVKEIEHAYNKAEESAQLLMPYLRPRLSVVKVQGGVKVTAQDLDEASDEEFLLVGRLIERAQRRALTNGRGVATIEGAAGIPEGNGEDPGAKPA